MIAPVPVFEESIVLYRHETRGNMALVTRRYKTVNAVHCLQLTQEEIAKRTGHWIANDVFRYRVGGRRVVDQLVRRASRAEMDKHFVETTANAPTFAEGEE